VAEFPSMPLWTDAYLADTGHLTTLEHGAYLLLLVTMWRAGGRLPNDDKKLARFARLNPGQWRRIKPTIMEFFSVADGFILQGRLTDELEFVKQKREGQSSKAKARWLKTKTTGDAPASPGICQPDAPTPTPTPKKKEESKDSPAFSEFWAAFPKRLGKKAAASKFRAAVKSGTPPQHIIDGAARYAAWVSENRIEERFIKHPTTWLNKGCWDDELKPQRTNQHGQPSRTARLVTVAHGENERAEDEPVEVQRQGSDADPSTRLLSAPDGRGPGGDGFGQLVG